ncbi:hypothetical protein T02_1525 [Trichinella nativa]|uniref:Uncharacterized protein n=1 Tax=Trichinella nativa TaxID=6335 RepID=A0A0V1LSN7_9BILA|nr:hypothetical protein T02_1525 [Trichinella nativa]
MLSLIEKSLINVAEEKSSIIVTRLINNFCRGPLAKDLSNAGRRETRLHVIHNFTRFLSLLRFSSVSTLNKLLSFLDVASDSQTSNRSLQTASLSPPFLLTRASEATDAAAIRRPSRQLTIEGERERAKPSGESKWRSQAENQSPKDTSCMDGPERGKDYAKNNTTGMSGEQQAGLILAKPNTA